MTKAAVVLAICREVEEKTPVHVLRLGETPTHVTQMASSTFSSG